MSIGGLMGFLIGLLPCLAETRLGAEHIWRASVSALGAGLLMRWWGQVWMRNCHQAHLQRAQNAEASQISANSHV